MAKKDHSLWIVLAVVVLLFILLMWWMNGKQAPTITNTFNTPATQNNIAPAGNVPEVTQEVPATESELEAAGLTSTVDESGEVIIEPIVDTGVPAEEPDPADQDIVN